MSPLDVLLFVLPWSGFVLLPWMYYRYRTKLSMWDGFVMSIAMCLPTALASIFVASLGCLILESFFPGAIWQHAGFVSLFLPWPGIVWFPLQARWKKRIA